MSVNLNPLDAWQEAAGLACLPDTQAASVFAILFERYSEPHRAYHTLHHLAQMLEIIARFRLTVHDYPALCLALWFHDAVYNTQRSDNEEQSAALMAGVLRPVLTEATTNRIQVLIMATKTHQAASEDTDRRLLIDADLAILGSSPADYDAYAEAIRREYAWVNDADYRLGRTRALRHFLAKPHIYGTPALFSELEQPGRANLQREIKQLS